MKANPDKFQAIAISIIKTEDEVKLLGVTTD